MLEVEQEAVGEKALAVTAGKVFTYTCGVALGSCTISSGSWSMTAGAGQSGDTSYSTGSGLVGGLVVLLAVITIKALLEPVVATVYGVLASWVAVPVV